MRIMARRTARVVAQAWCLLRAGPTGVQDLVLASIASEALPDTRATHLQARTLQ